MKTKVVTSQKKYANLQLDRDYHDRLRKVAAARRWNLKVACAAAIELLERESQNDKRTQAVA